MKLFAFVFPGQGSQSVGMLDAWGGHPAVAEALQEASDALGEDLGRLIREGPKEVLGLTTNTQPVMLIAGVAAYRAWRAEGGAEPYVLAGHSLGEYSALVAAGAMSLGDAAKSVRARGGFMQEAVPAGVGAMAAILGLEPAKVKAACEAAAEGQVVSPANYNSPEQTVIAGDAAAVERAGAKCKEAGAKRVMPLPVSAPFHCALMEPVKPKLAAVLGGVKLVAPSVPVVTNVEATPNSDVARIVPLLLEQVSAPVRWIECVEALKAEGVTRVVELGPGKVLCGLIKRITKDIELFNVEDAASLEKVLAALG